jgi:hypothetical protein
MKCARPSGITLSDGPRRVLPRGNLPVMRDQARLGRDKKSDDVERQVFPSVDNQAFSPVRNANAGYQGRDRIWAVTSNLRRPLRTSSRKRASSH